jgi:2-polyprenyl-6-methoxyphenol hydroxylase-like FAD-dependent oxidoreductase
MRVLIAGGGPTGLTLGIDLRRRGVDVRIVDKATSFFEGSRGDGLQPRTLEVFDDLGVLPRIRAAGMDPGPIRVHLDGTYVEERRMYEPQQPTPGVPYPNGIMLGQSQTEGILRERLAELGARVELGTEVTGLEQDADRVTVRFATGEHDRFDYVVGADGGGSTVRKAVGVAFEGTTDETFRLLIGDVEAPGLDPAAGYWFAREDQPRVGAVLTPLPSTGMFVFTMPLEEGDDASLENMQATLDRFKAGITLTGKHWSTVWRPNVRLAERYRVGRVFLAGDAAHVHPPTGGQGLNTGVQDAYNLGWKLASETALDTYETERRTEAARVLGVSTALLERYRQGADDAHRRGAEHWGLNITYRSPDATTALAPGDRAPDAPLTTPDGTPTTLFTLLRGPHSTRLTFAAAPSGTPSTSTETPAEEVGSADSGEQAWTVVRPGGTPSGKHHLIDVEGHAFAAYHATPGTTILIRPDGYIASIEHTDAPA